MKSIFPILMFSLFLAFPINAKAQTAELYQKKINKYESMRTIGITLTAASIPLGALGAYWFFHGDRTMDEDEWEGFFNGAAEVVLGTIVTFVAGASLAGGITITVIGSKKMKEYQSRLDGLKVGLYGTPGHAGITLTYRF